MSSLVRMEGAVKARTAASTFKSGALVTGRVVRNPARRQSAFVVRAEKDEGATKVSWYVRCPGNTCRIFMNHQSVVV